MDESPFCAGAALICSPLGLVVCQGKHVEDDAVNAGAVKAKETRQARQYMNRRGGFNRPLPAEKTGEKVTAS